MKRKYVVLNKFVRLEALAKLHNYYIDRDELILKGKEL